MSAPVGFTLTSKAHSPGKQWLGYWWYGEDGKHLGFEYCVCGIGPNDAEICAIELEQLAAAIRKKNREHWAHRKGARKNK